MLIEVGKDTRDEVVRILNVRGQHLVIVARLCDCTCRDGHVTMTVEEGITPPIPDGEVLTTN